MKDYHYIALANEAAAHFLDLCKDNRLPDEIFAEYQTARARAQSVTFTTDRACPIEKQEAACKASMATLRLAHKKLMAAFGRASDAVLAGTASIPELTLLSQIYPEEKSFARAIESEKRFRAEMASLQDRTHPEIVALDKKLLELEIYDCRRLGIFPSYFDPSKEPPPCDETLLQRYERSTPQDQATLREKFLHRLLAAEKARKANPSI
jgi:hypothetical protein